MIQQIGEKISDHHLIAYLCNIFIFLVYPRRNITFWKWAISNNRSFLHMLFKEDVLGRARYRHVNVKKVSVCVVCVEYDFFFYKNKTIFFSPFHFLPYLWPVTILCLSNLRDLLSCPILREPILNLRDTG